MQRADRPVQIPRGSSTYIPPPSPSPYSANSPPAAALTQPAPAPYKPPPITTFSDRVNSAIQAYPLEKGIGNNPIDQQQFIRQRAQPIDSARSVASGRLDLFSRRLFSRLTCNQMVAYCVHG